MSEVSLGRFTPEERAPPIGRLVGPTAGLNVLENSLLPVLGFEHRIVQPAAYSHTNYALPAHRSYSFSHK